MLGQVVSDGTSLQLGKKLPEVTLKEAEHMAKTEANSMENSKFYHQ